MQTYFLDSTYFAVPLARLCGISNVIRVRNNLGYWLSGRHRWLGRWMGRLAHLTLTNSDGGKQALIGAESLPAEKVAVLENGVDLERFPDPAPPDTGRDLVRVGIVANLRPVKNIDGLIRAAAELRHKHPRVRFEVAGDGEQRPLLEALIAQHHLRETFHLLGSVSDIPAFLAKQDIAVLCSHSEGMSNALLEFMAAGRAIVATDVGANGRLIDDRVHGLIVPANSQAALVGALTRFLENPAEARQMAAAARQRVENEYSREAMVKRFEEFYEAMILDRPIV